MQTPLEMEALVRANYDSLIRFRKEASDLKTARGIHYADVLQRLAEERTSVKGGDKMCRMAA
ncbi:MAG: hypothetical protein ABI988_08565 [Nitrospirota bacterium]